MELTQSAVTRIRLAVKRHAGMEAAAAIDEAKLKSLCRLLHMKPDEVTKVGYYLAYNWLLNNSNGKDLGFVLHPAAMKMWGEIRSCSAAYLSEVFEGSGKVPFSLGRLDMALQAYRLRYPSYIAREGDYEHWTAEVVCWMVGLGIMPDEQETYREFSYDEAYRYAWEKVPPEYAKALRKVASVEKVITMHREGIPLDYAISLIVG